jgi:hypothetical protein
LPNGAASRKSQTNITPEKVAQGLPICPWSRLAASGICHDFEKICRVVVTKQ